MGLVFSTFLKHTNQLATHSRRTGITAKDILTSCEELGLGGAAELMEELSENLPLEADGTSSSSRDDSTRIDEVA